MPTTSQSNITDDHLIAYFKWLLARVVQNEITSRKALLKICAFYA